MNNDIRWASYNAVGIYAGADHGKIVGNHIYESANGIYSHNGASAAGDDLVEHWLVAENHIHHLNDDQVYLVEDNHAIGWQNGRHITVEGNDVHHGGGVLVAFWIGQGFQEDIVIRNNFAHDNEPTRADDPQWLKAGILMQGNNQHMDPNKINRRWIYNNIVARVSNRGISDRTSQNSLGAPTSTITNNTVAFMRHFPSVEASRGATAYLLLGHAAGQLAASLKNNIGFNQAEGGYQVLHDSAGDTDFSQIVLDYNLWWHDDGTAGSLFKWAGNTTQAGLVAWQERTAAAGYPQDTHSLEVDPRFSNPSGSWREARDFTPRWDSPTIDAGAELPAEVPLSDFFGNPIYGPRDVGAIEFQPPYAMGVDRPDIAAEVRVYGDGRFRNRRPPSGAVADLALIPQSGDTSHVLDVSLSAWRDNPSAPRWSVKASTSIGNVLQRVGGLQSDRTYQLLIDDAPHTRPRADSKGVLEFTTAATAKLVTYALTPEADEPSDSNEERMGEPSRSADADSGPTAGAARVGAGAEHLAGASQGGCDASDRTSGTPPPAGPLPLVTVLALSGVGYACGCRRRRVQRRRARRTRPVARSV